MQYVLLAYAAVVMAIRCESRAPFVVSIDLTKSYSTAHHPLESQHQRQGTTANFVGQVYGSYRTDYEVVYHLIAMGLTSGTTRQKRPPLCTASNTTPFLWTSRRVTYQVPIAGSAVYDPRTNSYSQIMMSNSRSRSRSIIFWQFLL